MALLLCGATAFCAAPIGIQNSNPGNISGKNLKFWRRHGATGRDCFGHLIFRRDIDGLRAMRFVLAAYGRKGHDTIRDIAHRWTGHPLDLGRYGYATCLCQRLHAGLDDRLDMTPATIEALARALVLAENGRDPYPARLWREAFQGQDG